MATLEVRLRDLATRIATECKTIHTLVNGNTADNSSLTTTAKLNLVAAINEVNSLAQSALSGNGAKINDTSTASTTETYSVTKILSSINSAVAALRTSLDSNGDGKVDSANAADTAPWTGISNKPSTFPPSAHDASLITSGTIDPARIPILLSDKPVISTGGIAALTTAQQDTIVSGTLVTTTDGRRWTYTGTGSKIAEASYIEMADVTPDWSVIANKPSTRAGYGITDAQALDATLTALAGVTTAANQMIYATGVDAFAVTALSAFARSILDDTDATTVRATIGALSTVEIGNPDTDFVTVFSSALV